MEKSLENKVIIVTGGEGLLGREMVKNINLNGGIAISADISIATNLDKNQLNLDVTSEDAITAAFELVNQKFGKLDGIVNNAYPRTKDWGNKFEDIQFESWQKNVDLQMNSVFLCIQKAMPYLLKSKGNVVNIGSVYGVVGNDFTVYENTELTSPAAYSAIKGGLTNFTRYLASYFGKDGVRVNIVSPGGIFDNQNETFVKQYEHKVPMKRMGTPADIAPAVSFLLSDQAQYITGQNIIIDGGWTCI
jgi:NAD(P)-dependent dehydrogenase (short-subunit alcohol dehydrogenase family)